MVEYVVLFLCFIFVYFSKFSILSVYYGLSACIFPPNVEALTPNVIVFGSGAFGRVIRYRRDRSYPLCFSYPCAIRRDHNLFLSVALYTEGAWKEPGERKPTDLNLLSPFFLPPCHGQSQEPGLQLPWLLSLPPVPLILIPGYE